jgi:hypothetical protein
MGGCAGCAVGYGWSEWFGCGVAFAPPGAAGQHDEEGEDQDGEQCGAGPAGDLLDLLVAGAGEVAEQREADRPDQSAGGVEGQQPAVGHPGGAGQAGHHGAQERGEPGQEHRPSAGGAQRLLGAGQPLLAAGEDPGAQQPGAEVSTDLVADAVPEDRGRHRDGGDPRQRHLLPVGEHPAEQRRGLPGQHEPHEQRCFAEHQRADQRVGGWPVQVQDGVDDPC